MGGGTSKKYSQPASDDWKKESIDCIVSCAASERLVARVEAFHLRVVKSCKKIESFWLLLSSKLGQKKFKQYLKNEKLEEWLLIFLDLIRIKSSKIVDEQEILLNTIVELLKCYSSSETALSKYLNKTFGQKIKSIYKEEFSNLDFGNLLDEMISGIADVMATCFLLPFFNSRIYVTWRYMESSHATALTYFDIQIESNVLKIKNEEEEIKILKHIKKLDRVINPFDTAVSAMNKINKTDLNEFFDYQCDWLMTLLSTIDILPIGFFLTKVISKKTDDTPESDENLENEMEYPIIFMNRYLEEMTNLNHSLNENKNKSFQELLLPVETRNTIKLKECQRIGDEFIGSMPISRKDDWDFQAVVGFKALFNPEFEYCLGLGLILEVDGDIEKQVNVEDLFKQLLSTLPEKLSGPDNIVLSSSRTSKTEKS